MKLYAAFMVGEVIGNDKGNFTGLPERLHGGYGQGSASAGRVSKRR